MPDDDDVCEFCGQEYPKGAERYYVLRVFKATHKICGDCYDHFEEINKE